MPDHSALVEFYQRYGRSSFADDEPAYAQVCDDLAKYPELVELIAAHPREAQQPNLIFAAVHYLLLGGLDHPLREVYDGTSDADPSPLFADVVLSHRPEVDEILATKRTQTNEVGRCSLLALLLNHAAIATDQSLAWIDLGASGGLNLQVDDYRMDYHFGDRTESTGPSDSPLTLSCDVRSGSPLVLPAVAPIEWRIGVDRSPVDVLDPDQARWLQACLWPSKVDRAARLDAAIEVARDRRPEIVEADAVPGLRDAIERAPTDLTLVVTTSWVWYYLPRETQAQVLDVMRSADRRIFWFSLEGAGVVAELNEQRDRHAVTSTVAKMVVGDNAADHVEILGLSHPHGTHLTWHL